jgi:zinc D-Ala-D-Ala carboxypeptidase
MEKKIIITVVSFFILPFILYGCKDKQNREKDSGNQEKKFMKHCYEEPMFGHKKYPEYTGEKVDIGNDQTLAVEAAQAFLSMQKQAKKEGVVLIPRSGFRNEEVQKYLFYDIAKQRGQTLEERAKVSAPPGYSEHSTGYAIDINSLETEFAKSQEYTWMLENADKFGFEISFPENNEQGVSFEPWHWKYKGTQAAQEIFCKQKVKVITK